MVIRSGHAEGEKNKSVRMQGERKTYRVFVKTLRGGVKRHAERRCLKVPLSI